MMTSNNSPSLKGSQELTKTKGTIWKPLIAASLLPIFSFTAGQYFPYVIAAVSGSGAIVAVPLAIFAVSAVVALISTIYLIKLTVSRADNKKEAGPDGKESGHTPSQEPQKFVCENCTSLENKLSVPTPPPVTLGAQPSVSVSSPPPPPPPPPPSENSSTHPMRKVQDQDQQQLSDENQNALFEQIRQGTKLRRVDDESGTAKKLSNNVGEQKEDLIDDLRKKLAQRRNGASGKPGSKTQQSYNWTGVLSEMSAMIPLRSRSNSVSSSSSAESEQGWSDEENECSTPQSDGKKRSESPDSGRGSGDNVNSKPTFSPPKKEKPPVASKPADLQTRPPVTKMNNVGPVNNEVPNSPPSSLKERIKFFEFTGG